MTLKIINPFYQNDLENLETNDLNDNLNSNNPGHHFINKGISPAYCFSTKDFGIKIRAPISGKVIGTGFEAENLHLGFKELHKTNFIDIQAPSGEIVRLEHVLSMPDENDNLIAGEEIGMIHGYAGIPHIHMYGFKGIKSRRPDLPMNLDNNLNFTMPSSRKINPNINWTHSKYKK